MNRRSFLLTSAAVVGGSALLPLACGRPASASTSILPGVQLYTLRDVMAEDAAGTLEELAAIGYREVQTHTNYGMAPAEFRALLDDVGLTAPSAHVGSDAIRQNLDAVVDSAHTLGHQYVICPHPGALPYETIDDYRSMGAFFSEVGMRFAEAGIVFGYHNHGFEFEEIDGWIPLYAMLDEADPDNVVLELDLYWAVDGGADPLDVIERYPGRIHAFHVKDRTADGEMVEVGDGAIDFRRIFDRAEQAGLRHAFVEHDNPADALASVRRSFTGLQRLLG